MTPQKQDINADLGRHVEKLRQQHGLTREQFAQSSGLDLTVCEQLERGELSPTLAILRRICGALGIRLSELIEAIERPDPPTLFGARLVELRTRRGWDRQRLAQASGLDLDTIEGIETETVSPNLDMLRRLARGLGLKVSELFEDEP